jgi:hypothetical protein
MKRLALLIVATCAMFAAIIGGPASSTSALSTASSVVLAQVQAGSSTGATQEYVALYNNSDLDVDLTDWCVTYVSSSGSITNKPGCVYSADSQTQVWLKARSYSLFASTDFVTAHSGFVPDAAPAFAPGLSDSSGTLILKDADGVEQDRFAWSAKAGAGLVYSRKLADSLLVELLDTDQATDFEQIPLVTPSNTGLYEVVVPLDVCPNIEGLQEVMSYGYLQDSEGQCQVDVCLNQDGLQLSIPDGYESLDGENCTLVPLESATIFITEILPNTTSYDTGKEFIELYNPNTRVVFLNGYLLQVGPSFGKDYLVPDVIIQPGQYLTFSDTVTGIVLPNSSASLKLIAPAGNTVSLSGEYISPRDDQSWSLIDDVWQFTNRPTPGSANLENLTEGGQGGGDEEVTVLAPCPAGKYRNPETNRCRNLETVVSSLSPCDEDEYRNPETNRCRKVVGTLASSASLVPCKEGQERNPETNRCRSVASAAEEELKPCEPDEERNPETNRCRKKSSTLASVASSQLNPSSGAISVNKVMLLVGMFATVGYGMWEYRTSLHNAWIRAVRKFSK